MSECLPYLAEPMQARGQLDHLDRLVSDEMFKV